jgi:glycosyltransferase involved in cell wall biosynthesis
MKKDLSIITVNYNHRSLIDFQRDLYRNSNVDVFVVENSNDESQVCDFNIRNPNRYSFDGESHGSSIDLGVKNTESEYVIIMDSDFILFDVKLIPTMIEYMKEHQIEAFGTPYGDGESNNRFIASSPETFVNIPCIYFLIVKRTLLEDVSFMIGHDECYSNMQKYGCYVEVGFQLRKKCFENKIKTESFQMYQHSPGYGKCFYKWNGDDVGYHHFGGCHTNKYEVLNTLVELRGRYNDKNV